MEEYVLTTNYMGKVPLCICGNPRIFYGSYYRPFCSSSCSSRRNQKIGVESRRLPNGSMASGVGSVISRIRARTIGNIHQYKDSDIGYLYMLRFEDSIKIGVTKDLAKRHYECKGKLLQYTVGSIRRLFSVECDIYLENQSELLWDKSKGRGWTEHFNSEFEKTLSDSVRNKTLDMKTVVPETTYEYNSHIFNTQRIY